MAEYITAYEYEKNVNPQLKNIPIDKKNIDECDYGITFIDFSELYNVDYKSTTPNLLASFIKIKAHCIFSENSKVDKNLQFTSSSNLFYIMTGSCEIKLDDETHNLSDGDIFIFPFFESIQITNKTTEDLCIYYINDSPLNNYLGSRPEKKIFKSSIYPKEFLLNNLHTLSDPKNNRKGVLLSNKDTEHIGTNTITPILWALYNELPSNTVQRPHKHNSVALDLCIGCSDSENIYTLLGDELDENGNIVNPVKVNWKQGEMFITPPGLWHSHNNTGDSVAYILPIQDAGLLLYQRILGIVLH
uniref:Cupin 2 conserved barrel domain-containing protein n=1 Tax=viral metagenome TaxID=1070528 RepID=A0A6C0DIV3_9ZZZZ